jgi:hypothetical protein
MHTLYNNVPAVADDAWAVTLADPPLLHTALRAIHIGNSNGWWSKQGIKHTAVAAAVKEYEGEQ